MNRWLCVSMSDIFAAWVMQHINWRNICVIGMHNLYLRIFLIYSHILSSYEKLLKVILLIVAVSVSAMPSWGKDLGDLQIFNHLGVGVQVGS